MRGQAVIERVPLDGMAVEKGWRLPGARQRSESRTTCVSGLWTHILGIWIIMNKHLGNHKTSCCGVTMSSLGPFIRCPLITFTPFLLVVFHPARHLQFQGITNLIAGRVSILHPRDIDDLGPSWEETQSNQRTSNP